MGKMCLKTGFCPGGGVSRAWYDSGSPGHIGGGRRLHLLRPPLAPAVYTPPPPVPQRSAKIEYLFVGFERQADPGNSDNHVLVCGGAGSSFCWDHEFDGVHTVKVGVNYHF
jgi:hypothetical protein